MDFVTASIADHLSFLYGEERGANAASRLEGLLREASTLRSSPPPTARPVTQRDAMLIAYPDQLHEPGKAPLATLKAFVDRQAREIFTAIHLLPFFPSSSDDGFAVTDYLEVDPRYGTWDDVRALAENYRLVVDAVLNHASARGRWFAGFLRGEDPWRGYFLTPDPFADWSRVVRPRTSSLFTPIETAAGPASVWTTFSPDQVDLNYANPDLLLVMIGILFEYLRRGGQWLRLDAVGFLWKEPGTTCLHLPQTHRLLCLLREVVDVAAPWARLITETNVTHADNVAYFGGGHEAHMVYQFALAPLIVHTLISGNAAALTAWASRLVAPPTGACFLNFLASHDGLGLVPAMDCLTAGDIERLTARAQARGGVSYRTLSGGGVGPYEVNANLLDLLDEPGADGIQRFVTAHAILLAFAGIPAIYFHSLVGSRGDPAGVERTGARRSINRQKLPAADVEAELAVPGGLRRRVFDALRHLLRVRGSLPALDPTASQQALDLGPHVFALRRVSADGQELFCVAETASQSTRVSLPAAGASGIDVLAKETVRLDSIAMAPLQPRWITVNHE